MMDIPVFDNKKEIKTEYCVPNIRGRKDDLGKLRYSLIPAGVIEEVVKVLMVGANIYGDDNWQQVENARTRYYDALRRHAEKRRSGEIRDKDSGLLHAAHEAANALFAVWQDLQLEQEEI